MNLPEQPDNAGPGSGLARLLANPVLLCLLLAVVTLAVYRPVTHCDFVNYDDPDYFTANPQVLAGLTPGNVAWAFSTGLTGNWHPLTWLSLMLDVDLFGPGPAGPHLTNLLFHLANTILLFVVLRRLTAAYWRSALVAALFALHPLHVESVAWISERKDVLSTFFGLWSLWAYAGYVEKSKVQSPGSKVFYGLALVFFALGLMSKPMLVTWPFVMLLLDWWPLGRVTGDGWRGAGVRHLLLEKIPFFLLSAASCVVTFIAQQKGGAVVALMKISLAERLENTFISYARYLGKTFWPTGLVSLYPYVRDWAMGLVILSVLLFLGLSIAAIRLRHRFPFITVGWFWFAGTLIPVIGLVQVGVQSLADRYTYVPLTGLFIIFAWGFGKICTRWSSSRPFIVGFTLLMLVAGALRTRDQIGYWQNNEVLFRHALALTKNNYVAYNNLGSYLSHQGRVTEGLECFIKSLQINPDDPDVLYNLGNALTKLDDLDGAVHAYRRALELTPGHADILNNLGFALASKGQFAEATTCFEQALQLNPDYAEAHNNFANVLFYQHKFNEAIPHYRAALRSDPQNPQLYSNLADTLVKVGQIPEAVHCYQEALRLRPGDPQVTLKLQTLGVPASR